MANSSYRPIIAVSPTQNIAEEKTTLSTNYTDSIVAAGGIPIILPLTEDLEVIETIMNQVDGLLLTGGDDIEPQLYGMSRTLEDGTPNPELEGLGDTTPLRDHVEICAAHVAFKRNLPVRAICRGMQLIVALSGGELICDMPLARKHGSTVAGDGTIDHQSKDYSKLIHTVSATPGTRLASIFGTEPFMVNSIHHQCIKSLNSQYLTATLFSADGVIEGIEANHFLGLQWHPEYYADKDSSNMYSKFFFTLIEEAKEQHCN